MKRAISKNIRNATCVSLVLLGFVVCFTRVTCAASDKRVVEAPLPPQKVEIPHQEATPFTFAPLVHAAEPAVVMIKATVRVANTPEMQFPPGFPLGDLFKQFQLPPTAPKTRKEFSLGSGFIVDPAGIIVTNNHVIKGAEKIVVQFNHDQKDYKASVIGVDESTDIAVLKVNIKHPLPSLSWADSSLAQVGDRVLAIGNPIGLGGTVTSGIVSAQGRNLASSPYDNFIQTDASINKGNSGGPLINMKGEVLGINTAIYSPDGGSIGIGFAIPSNQAKKIVTELLKDGKIKRGWIGVMIQPVTEDIAGSLGMPNATGALVVKADPASPSAKAGIKQGDVILSFNNQVVSESQKLPEIVATAKIGTKVPVVVWRNGKKVTLTLLVKVKKDTPAGGGVGQKQLRPTDTNVTKVLGLTVQNITPPLRDHFGLDTQDGIVVTDIDQESQAFDRGVRAGDVIVSINQKPIRTLLDIAKILAKNKKGPYLFLLNRGGQQYYVALGAEGE